jgi:hypothetical protein
VAEVPFPVIPEIIGNVTEQLTSIEGSFSLQESPELHRATTWRFLLFLTRFHVLI